jgi:uncharacterized protein (DUF924 family)
LRFWFQECSPAQWWQKDEGFDQLIIGRFSELYGRAIRCELFGWRAHTQGRLAEIIVLDQFSRNMFRGSPHSYAQDALALALAQEAVAASADLALAPEERVFLYMPYTHSESRVIHETAERLFRDRAPPLNYDFELRHKAIIDRFGRYPHRNSILDRQSTPKELAYLAEAGAGF